MYSAVVFRQVLQRRLEPWRWGAQQSAIGSWQPPIERIIEADPPTTTWEVAEELNVDQSMVVQHLKQTEKAKKLGKWMPHEFRKKKCFVLKCHLLLFYATMNQFLIKLWCAIKRGFYMTISNDQLSVWTKKLQSTCQSQTCTQKKVTGHCLVVCCWNDPLQLSESQWNH